MAANPEKSPFFSVDNTGTQRADLDAYFQTEEGKRELEKTARAIASLKIPGVPEEDAASSEPHTAPNQR